jgi:hypothetical protein
MDKPQPGQEVEVVLKGTVMKPYSTDKIGSGDKYADFIKVRDANSIYHWIWWSNSQKLGESHWQKVSTPDPTNWPPKVGQIWDVNGVDYHILAYGRPEEGKLEFVPGNRTISGDRKIYYNDEKSGQSGLEAFKNLKPVLVFSPLR